MFPNSSFTLAEGVPGSTFGNFQNSEPDIILRSSLPGRYILILENLPVGWGYFNFIGVCMNTPYLQLRLFLPF